MPRWDRGRPARSRDRLLAVCILVALLALDGAASATTPVGMPSGDATPGSDRATASHSFADVDYWSSIFDNPDRDAWQKPKALLAALALRPGQTVADLGAGTGYFSRYLAEAV